MPADVARIRKMVVFVTPAATQSRLGDEWEARCWTVTLAAEVSDVDSVQSLDTMSEAATAIVHSSLVRKGEDAGLQEVCKVEVAVVDSMHLILVVSTRKADRDREYLGAAGAAMRALDAKHPIADVQGIPRRFWRLPLGLQSEEPNPEEPRHPDQGTRNPNQGT